MSEWETKRVLVTVRTYPVPAAKGAEVSCTAGITADRGWIRLFPIPYRHLERASKFSKYDWIDVDVRGSSDTRPESYKVNPDSIHVISKVPPDQGWNTRKNLIFPLRQRSLCELKRQRDSQGFPTLGIFKPKDIQKLIVEADPPVWTEKQIAQLHQMTLWDRKPLVDLEKLPHRFLYQFTCDDSDCSGHRMSCTDWEMAQSYRIWRDQYGSAWEDKFRQKYADWMFNERDTHFYVGTMHHRPSQWIIVGLFYPPL